MINFPWFLASLSLYLFGLSEKNGVILIAAALFALASNVGIKINIGGEHDGR